MRRAIAAAAIAAAVLLWAFWPRWLSRSNAEPRETLS